MAVTEWELPCEGPGRQAALSRVSVCAATRALLRSTQTRGGTLPRELRHFLESLRCGEVAKCRKPHTHRHLCVSCKGLRHLAKTLQMASFHRPPNPGSSYTQ